MLRRVRLRRCRTGDPRAGYSHERVVEPVFIPRVAEGPLMTSENALALTFGDSLGREDRLTDGLDIDVDL